MSIIVLFTPLNFIVFVTNIHNAIGQNRVVIQLGEEGRFKLVPSNFTNIGAISSSLEQVKNFRHEEPVEEPELRVSPAQPGRHRVELGHEGIASPLVEHLEDFLASSLGRRRLQQNMCPQVQGHLDAGHHPVLDLKHTSQTN